MKYKILGTAATLMVVVLLITRLSTTHKSSMVLNLLEKGWEEGEEKSEEQRAFFTAQRWQHEFNMLKDPLTGKIPANIRMEEMKMAMGMPVRGESGVNGPLGADNLNTYLEAGPNNIGGRTRAVAFDKRYNGTSNRVIIAGSVSGGIMRSVDGGANWTRVSPDNDIHNLTALAQDPRAGFENTWYAGGGEPIANSASGAAAFYLGFGIWKSTDNGATWTKLQRQVTDLDGTTILGGGSLEVFDNPLDIAHKIAVNPVNGDVYICGHRRLVRSTNGGTSWNVVFSGGSPTTSALGQLDMAISTSGKMYLGVNGGLPDPEKRGVWTSANGTTWTQIAGGSILGTDSVANWKGNDYTGESRRIMLALAPSNQNILYVTYENGESQSGASGKPEVDLFKVDLSAAPAWTNLSANVPDFSGQLDGVDPFHVQGGYDLMIAVKPNDPNAVFLGGVNLFRSTNGFSNTTGTNWIGGYGANFPSGLNIYGSQANGNDISKWSHPDMHALVFDPSNPSRAICANDGGLQITADIMGNAAGDEPVSWNVVGNYQTLQYYHVAMDPGAGRLNFAGGAQDNGTRFRDASGVLAAATNNAQYRILSGDGAGCALAKAGPSSQILYGSSQFGNIIRATLAPGSITGGSIRPTGLTATPGAGSNAFGDFVTYFELDFDNTEDLYYVNFNRLFRTTAASTVTSSGWTELTGVGAAVNPGLPTSGTNIIITTMELSRGDYASSHVLYLGTSNGKLFRLNNPRNSAAATAPVNITPPLLTGYINDIAVNPNNDEEVMVVVSNYGTTSVWWTNNAKSATPTWSNAEGNLTLPSYRSCAIVVKKDGSNNPVTEYYVGTSVGLYSAIGIGTTLQGGGSVSWVREGGSVLNFAVVSSLDYRPQDNYLLVGTHGNGMYYAQTGTPDFRPNQNTGLPDPIRNDKNFIQRAYPTVVKESIAFQTGNMFTVKKLDIRIFNMNGQLLLQQRTGYSSGNLDTRKLAKGSYILSITSDDYKQQFIQKFVKN